MVTLVRKPKPGPSLKPIRLGVGSHFIDAETGQEYLLGEVYGAYPFRVGLINQDTGMMDVIDGDESPTGTEVIDPHFLSATEWNDVSDDRQFRYASRYPVEFVFRVDKPKFPGYGAGTTFKNAYSGEFYVLAATAVNQVSLICINDGRRWEDGKEVDDIDNLTWEEWGAICQASDFTDTAFERVNLDIRQIPLDESPS